MQHSSSSSGRSVHHRPVHCFYQWIAQSDQLDLLLALLSIKLDANLIPTFSPLDNYLQLHNVVFKKTIVSI